MSILLGVSAAGVVLGAASMYLLMRWQLAHQRKIAATCRERARFKEAERDRFVQASLPLFIEAYTLMGQADGLLESKVRFTEKVSAWQERAHEYRAKMHLIFRDAGLEL